MVYFKDFSKHQKAPFKGVARKSLIFIFILFYLLLPYRCGDCDWGQRELVQERRALTFGEE